MPSVALESTVFVHGLPHPLGLETALEMEAIVRRHGAEPRTIGIIGGRAVVGLSGPEMEHLATSAGVRKASTRDLPVVRGLGRDAATTVAGTVTIAYQEGIEVVCTGGIGGIHRGDPWDASNDLTVLGSTPATVVCSGAKTVLDLRATRERLETLGVTVIGYQTDEFPGFYTRTTGLPVDVRCDEPQEVAEIVNARRALGLERTSLVCVPAPKETEVDPDLLEDVITSAIDRAGRAGITGADVTPFLLEAVAEATGGASLRANTALLRNNASVAARIAVAVG